MIIPMLRTETKTIPSEKKQEQNWLGTDGVAIFKEGKLVDTISAYEMRGAMWILGKMRDAEITVNAPTDGKPLDFMINQSHSKIKPIIEGNQITMHIHCKADASLISSQSNIPLQDPAQIKKLEDSLEELVKIRIRKAIESSQKVGADVFQFGSYLDWYVPSVWKEVAPRWRKVYRENVKIAPHVEITIKRLGTTKNPIRFHPAESSSGG